MSEQNLDSDEKGFIPSPENPDEGRVALENHDEEDVAMTLERETADGPGDLDSLPESDFEGFASGDVEEDE